MSGYAQCITRKAELDEQVVIAGYRAGKSLRDLAAEHGVSVGPIQALLKDHGVERRAAGVRGPDRGPRKARATARATSSFSPEEKDAVLEGFKAGEAQGALGNRFNCSATTIARVLREMGVEAGTHGQVRDHHHNWRGGRVTHPSGYVMVRPETDDVIGQTMKGSKRKYVLEHRLVMAHALGRPLVDSQTVHHVNGNKSDNRLENLQLRVGRHGKNSVFRCRACGSQDIEAVELHLGRLLGRAGAEWPITM